MRHYFFLSLTFQLSLAFSLSLALAVAPLAQGVFAPTLRLVLITPGASAQRRPTPLLAALVRAVALAMVAL
jgi:hypothetical protein